MNNYITLYGEVLGYPNQVSVDKRGKAYYSFSLAAERVSGIKDIVPILVEEGTPAFKSLVEIDQKKDLLETKLLITGRIRTRNLRVEESSRLQISVRAQEIKEQEYEGDNNGVVMTAFVCKVGELRTTPRGIRITDMTLACWREDGSGVSDYIPAITWNGTAVRASENLKVGDCIELRGRLQSREYTKEQENGETEVRTCYELSIEKFEKAKMPEKKES